MSENRLNLGNTEIKETVPSFRSIMKEEMQQMQMKMEENERKMKEELKIRQEQQLNQLRDEEARKNKIVIYGIPESKEKEGIRDVMMTNTL